MAQYEVQGGQNIWDIAIQLHGSIEGVFDLMISNPKLSLSSTLRAGDVLDYHEQFVINRSIVDSIAENEYLPANGERKVYYKDIQAPLMIMAKYPEYEEHASFAVAGDGQMVIDWGDNSSPQIVNLTNEARRITHYFDNTVEQRRIKIFGEFALSYLDLTGFKGSLYPIRPIIVDEMKSVANTGDLRCLFLFKGMVSLDLRNTDIDDLSPIYDYGKDGNLTEGYNGLQVLNLEGAKFKDISVLNNYLEYLAGSETHGTRRPCHIYLTTEPTERGMEAIQTILGESAWNEDSFASSWVFTINGTNYTTE